MTFQDAIISVINDFGKDILSNASLQNCLNDYSAMHLMNQNHLESY